MLQAVLQILISFWYFLSVFFLSARISYYSFLAIKYYISREIKFLFFYNWFLIFIL